MPRVPALLAAVAVLSACGTSLPGSGPESPVAARVNGEVITVAEIDATIAPQLYEIRKEALDKLITQRAVAREAEKRGVAPEDLIETAAEPVTDADVAAFYDEREAAIRSQVPDATLESVGPQIRSILESERQRDFVRALRAAAQVEVALEQPRVEVSVAGRPSLGPDDARVTIVEFSDFQCPYCRRASPVMRELVAKYPGDVRVVYRHLPLANHPRARPSAEASACAADQDAFWEYHDLVFENPGALADEDLLRFAGELELDVAAFEDCYRSGRHAELVREDVRAAESAGITGTPGFVVNGLVVTGFRPAEAFDELIRAELDRGELDRGEPGES